MKDFVNLMGIGFTLVVLAAFALVAALIGGGVWLTFQSYADEQVRTCAVENKDRSEDSMRVYTEQCGVLDVSDKLFLGHFNASDVWADIEGGETYEFRTVGKRIPFFSMFPTVVEVSE